MLCYSLGMLVAINWINTDAGYDQMHHLSHVTRLLFVLRKLILQTRMRSHPVGLDVWRLVGPFVYCVRTANALARLRGCAGSPEPSLVAYVISTIISWAGSLGNINCTPCLWFEKSYWQNLKKFYLSRDITKPTKWVCAQRRLRSA